VKNGILRERKKDELVVGFQIIIVASQTKSTQSKTQQRRENAAQAKCRHIVCQEAPRKQTDVDSQ
jgi:hypothetical protein